MNPAARHVVRLVASSLLVVVMLTPQLAPAQVSLLPGATVTPNAFDPGGQFVKSELIAFSGMLHQMVVVNTLGTLDFYYQVVNPVSPFSFTVDFILVDDFSGYTTDVFYRTDGGSIFDPIFEPFAPGGEIPTIATRDSGPGVGSVRFDFTQGRVPGLPPGENSAVIGIRTNATEVSFFNNFTARGNLGFVTTHQAFGPAGLPVGTSVPEAPILGLFAGLAVPGLALYRRRT